MSIAAFFPDIKDKDEEIAERVKLSQLHPVRYVGQCIREALWFPFATVAELGHRVVGGRKNEAENQEIGKFKRQFTGLGMAITGVCSFLSGFRNVRYINQNLPAAQKVLAANLEYYKNPAHSIGGAITALAGTQLLLATGGDKGWAAWGETQWLRMSVLYSSIRKKFKSNDSKPYYYLGGQVAFQTSNTISHLIGGAEKRPDGTIVDHKVMREDAKLKVREHKALLRDEATHKDGAEDVADREALPSPKISKPSSVEHAMPERVAEAAVAAEKKEAVVA